MSKSSSIPAPSDGDDGEDKSRMVDDICQRLGSFFEDRMKVLMAGQSKNFESSLQTIRGSIESIRSSSHTTPDSAIAELLLLPSSVRRTCKSSAVSNSSEIGSSDDGDPIIESIESHCDDEKLSDLLAGFEDAEAVK
jgi:hypothetical protein